MSAIYPPMQVAADFAWRESQAMRAWMNDITTAANTGSASVRSALPGNGSNVPTQIGFDCAISSLGAGTSATYTAPSGTAPLTSLYRIVYASGAGAGSGYNLNAQTQAFWFGNAAGLGGFVCEFVFGISAPQSGMRIAVGLFPLADVSPASDPSGQLNCIFIGADAADANLQVMTNNAAGTCTKVDLGAKFAKSSAGLLARATFTARARASAVDYVITRVDSAAIAAGTLTADLPSNTTFLNPQFMFGNGTTAAKAEGAFVRMTCETSV